MADEVTPYHNPACRTSRDARATSGNGDIDAQCGRTA
jgi:arsenate reductase-like glutaredoxin family protein